MGRSSGDPSRNWIFGSQAENERVSAGRADRARDRENQPPYFLVQGARAAITLIYAERYSPKRITGAVVRLDPIKRWLILQSEEDRKTIPLTQIIGAEEESKRHPVGGLFFRTFMTSSTRFSVQSSR